MNKKIIFLLIITGSLFAQNLDSLYNHLLKIQNKIPHKHNVLSSEEKDKCGFGTVLNIRQNINQFDIQKQNEIKSVLTRPATQKSIVSPNGFFRIHYDETGTNAISYDVNELAAAFDSVYNFEITKLGFLPPPNDGGLGGDNLYDVYVQNLGTGMYGYTDPENEIPTGSGYYSSYMMIDNDFGAGFPTNGIDGAKVTAAHEFHHAIQLGNYSSNFDDLFYFEITSTSMEEFVFDEINDYYYYLPSYFADPAKRFYYVQGSNAGYNRAIWNIYLSDKFEIDIIKSIWEKMRTSSAIESVASAIGDRGSSFKSAFNEFATWIWFTGSRAEVDNYFEEGNFYPQVKVKSTYQLSPTEISFSAEHIANEFLLFVDNSGIQADSLLIIVSECDINSAINLPNSVTAYNLKLNSSIESGEIQVNDKYYSVLLESSNEGMFETVWILNNSVNQSETEIRELEFAYPQPFYYSKYDNVFLPASKKAGNLAELYVYSSDMNLVFSGSQKVFMNNNAMIIWDAKDSSGNKIPSGIYYYVVNSNDNIKKGKIAIFND